MNIAIPKNQSHRPVWHALALGFATFGYVLAFIIALVVGVLTHLGLPAARKFAVDTLNASLASSFKGKIVVGTISHLGLGGVGGVDAKILAPDGSAVISGHGVRARINPVALLRTLVARKGDIGIGVFDIDIESAEVVLDGDGAGSLKIADAFELAKPSAPANPNDHSRGVVIDLSNIRIKHVWAHGAIPGAPPIDADADDIRAAVHVANDVRIDVAHVHIKTRAMTRGANPDGEVAGNLVIPTDQATSISFAGSFDGAIGGIPTHARAKLSDDVLTASADVPEVDAAKIRALAPEVPLYLPTAVHVEAIGPLSGIDARVHATLGPGEVDASAHLVLAGKLAGTAHVNAKQIDVRAFAESAPPSSLGAIADVSLYTAASDDTMHGAFDISVPPGRIAGQGVPSTHLSGTFDQVNGSSTIPAGFKLETHVHVAEAGAPTDLAVSLKPSAAGQVINVDAHTVVARLEDVKRVGGLGPGRADVHVTGAITLAKTPVFDANVDAVTDGLERSGIRIVTATVAAHGSGTFDNPKVEASVDATGVSAQGYAWDRLHVVTSGSLVGAEVSLALDGRSTPTVTGHAHVALNRGVTVSDADLTLRRENTALRARVATVRILPNRLDVDGAEITGVGDPLVASVTERPGTLTVRAHSAGLDVHEVATLLGVEKRIHGGRVALDINLEAGRASAEGTALVDLSHGSFDNVKEVAAHIDATMKGRQTTGTIHGAISGVGALDATRLDVTVGGEGPLSVSAWRRSFGRVQLDGEVDLARAAALLPPNTLPMTDVGGVMIVSAHAFRASESDAQPDLKLSLVTRGLRASARGGPDEAKHGIIVTKPAWSISGIDAALDANTNGSTNYGELSLRVMDGRGAIVTFDAKSGDLPLDRIIAGSADLQDRLLHTPFTARAHVPDRKLTELPDLIRPEAAKGIAHADITFDGTALEPKLLVDGGVRQIHFAAAPGSEPLDATVHATYDGKTGDATAAIGSQTESYLHAEVHANADASALSKNSDAWDGSAHATLVHFPIGTLAELGDRDVRGRVSGEVTITDLHKDARLKANIDLDNVHIGRARFTKGNIIATYDGHALLGRAHIEQTDGAADADAKLALTWGAALTPSPDANGDTSANLTAKNFRAAFLEPLLSSAVDELDGYVDANAHIALSPGKKPEMSGAVTVRDGRVDVAAIGEELHGMTAKVSLTQGGAVKLEDVVAYGSSGMLTASGAAQLDGTALVSAQASLAIDKKSALPLAVGGANMGTVFGRVDAKVVTSQDRKTTNVDVSIPDFHILIPESSPHAVQDLDAQPDNIHIGVAPAAHKFIVLIPTGDDAKKKTPQTPTKLTLALHLGNIEVKRGTEVNATLGGEPVVTLSDKTTMTGAVILKNGKLDVQGKQFEIKRGTATFVGDPSNPEINVTASWKADDGTEVFADYIGPLKTGKVVLRAEPPRPQNEIVALILFGSADGSQATPYSQPAEASGTKAGTTVGGFATGGLNKGIDKLTGMDITTKIDTSQANPRPEVEVQIAKSISLQLAFVLGTPPPGTNPDTTYATIDWRFVRNWSLATTFGNLGSSIADVIWQYRY